MAGTFGGRRLAVPPGQGTRPTSDRVREALFNTLESLTVLAGARFADLYAGSGAIGLEARSRGAAEVLLVEQDPRAARAAQQNIRALDVAGSVRLRRRAVSVVLGDPPAQPYDVVFADPPYALADERIGDLQRALLANGWLADDAVLVIERASRSGPVWWVPPVTGIRERRYGETTLWYGQRS